MTLTHFHLDPLSGLFWSMQTGPKRPNKGLTVWISQIVFAHWSIRWLNSHSMPIFILPKVPHCDSLDKPVTLLNYMILYMYACLHKVRRIQHWLLEAKHSRAPQKCLRHHILYRGPLKVQPSIVWVPSSLGTIHESRQQQPAAKFWSGW